MRRSLPSMMSLQAFEASARHMSFTDAARELCLTQGAVSRQIRLLEAYLGQELFRRIRNRLVFTEAGEQFLEDVREGLDSLDAAVLRLLSGNKSGGVVNLATHPAFGARWLMPRFPSFADTYPTIDVNIFTRTGTVDFAREPFDAAIHFGVAAIDGVRSDWLVDEDPVPVCSPALTEADDRLCRPEGFGRFKLLQQAPRPRAWADWMEAAGMEHGDCLAGPRFEQIMVMIEAARAGLGLALVPRFLIKDELARGQLIVPFQAEIRSGWGYWLVYPEPKLSSPALRTFRGWILGEAAHLGTTHSSSGPDV